MRKRRFLTVILSILLVFSMIFSATSCKNDSSDSGKFNTESLRGKVAIINIWGTWCPPCRRELPEFDRIAKDFKDEVTVIAVHSTAEGTIAPRDFVDENLPDSEIIFLRDKNDDGDQLDDYYSAVGGSMYYPFTVILDKNGVITGNITGATTYSALAAEIEKAKIRSNAAFNPDGYDTGSYIGDICPDMELDYLF